ncbi:MAG: phospholipid/cholesterol/gamma-HCH transport system substrate-binding protein [Thermoleophilaceae bacterium]|nr:phospholipid/cholesterol/gamma-HCH transport system substrate-binding protein [Thermoleophilaceae bacterium]
MAPPNSTDPRNPSADGSDEGGGSLLARVAAVAVVLAAVVIVALLLFTGGSEYTVKVQFENAGQLVKGNQVQVGGRPIGTIKDISLTADGQAQIEISIDELKPLHEGTTAVIRSTSLSGIANRYVALSLGPQSAKKIDNGGYIRADRTTSPVDLDQLFNTLDPATRKGLQDIIQGSAAQYGGKVAEANQSLRYFNPALSTSSTLLRELVRDRVVFKHFVTDTANVVTDLADRRGDLTQLVGNANATAAAIGSENAALARTLDLLPPTMREANTTFVNLRATLDDLDVLVAASKPASRHLARFLRVLRPLVRDSRPTIRDLRQLVHTPGAGNDLTDLLLKSPKLAALTDTVFPRSVKALQKTQPVLEYARPYTPDFAGWLTKFGQSAAPYDANGHYARIQPLFNAFQFNNTPTGPVLTPNQGSRLAGLQTGKNQRCPGGAMQPPPDKSAPYLETSNFQCDPSAAPPGP